MAKDLMINEKIRDKEVRLIGEDGAQLGIVPLKQALDMALERDLDLVKIAPQAAPPVCKIMDYGKHRFEAAKKEKENRKNQKIIVVKEVQLSPNIAEHDFAIKKNQAERLLKDGDKVKVTIRFRGRETTYASRSEQTMKRFGAELNEIAIIEKLPKLEGKSMQMHLTPRPPASS